MLFGVEILCYLLQKYVCYVEIYLLFGLKIYLLFCVYIYMLSSIEICLFIWCIIIIKWRRDIFNLEINKIEEKRYINRRKKVLFGLKGN